MNRRRFLGWLGALVGGVALEQAIPFNRIWSFPSKIVLAKPEEYVLAYEYIKTGHLSEIIPVADVDQALFWANEICRFEPQGIVAVKVKKSEVQTWEELASSGESKLAESHSL